MPRHDLGPTAPDSKPFPVVPRDLLERLEALNPTADRLTERVSLDLALLHQAIGARKLVNLLREQYERQNKQDPV